MKKILAVMLLALPFMANAEDTELPAEYSLMVNGLTVHTKSEIDGQKLNGVNPGLGIRVKGGIFDEDGALTIGEYYNSYRKTTAYALYEYTPLHYGRFDIGGFGGLVIGYTSSQNGINPLAAGAVVRVKLGDRSGITFHAVPPVGADSAGFVSINFDYRIGK